MTRWSEQDAINYAKRRSQAVRAGDRSLPVVQKLEDVSAREADNSPEEAEVDGSVHPRFAVTITLLTSDKRRRDADGAMSTLLDCLVKAVRRLNPLDT